MHFWLDVVARLYGALLPAGEHVLELHHAGVGEHQRRVVRRDERPARHDLVAALGEVTPEAIAYLEELVISRGCSARRPGSQSGDGRQAGAQDGRARRERECRALGRLGVCGPGSAGPGARSGCRCGPSVTVGGPAHPSLVGRAKRTPRSPGVWHAQRPPDRHSPARTPTVEPAMVAVGALDARLDTPRHDEAPPFAGCDRLAELASAIDVK